MLLKLITYHHQQRNAKPHFGHSIYFIILFCTIPGMCAVCELHGTTQNLYSIYVMLLVNRIGEKKSSLG